MPVPSLKAVSCSHQPGAIRFPSQDEVPSTPLGMWRNNVTALSQYYNLYFVAYLDQIYVYQPQYPSQIVGGLDESVACFKLPKSGPGLRGYIVPSRPQGVNHLIVRDLGEEEILLLACDGGDVIAYRTRDIWKALCQPSRTRSKAKLSLSSFFHENVGASAWGIDVHKNSRMIAVSSNTHEIVIFAFALSFQDFKDSRETAVNSTHRILGSAEASEKLAEDALSHDYEYGRTTSRLAGVSRGRTSISTAWKMPENGDCRFCRTENNYAWSLIGHGVNIPAIAFYNGSSDPCARVVLMSTDIDRKAYAWDVWEKKRYLQFNHQSRGWGVACIDPQTARICHSEVETFGCKPQIKASAEQWGLDNSSCVSNVPDNSQWHPSFPKPTPDAHTSFVANTQMGVISAVIQSQADPSMAVLTDYGANNDEEEVNDDQDQDEDTDEEEEQSHEEDIDEEVEVVEPDHEEDTDVEEGNDEQVNQDLDQQELIEVLADDLASNEGSPSHLADDNASLLDTNARLCRLETFLPLTPLAVSDPSLDISTHSPCNFLCTTESDVLLTDGRFIGRGERQSKGTLLCEKSLMQAIPPGFAPDRPMERLNMVSQIPELGIVVIGNQVGRVGLYTMTYWPEKEDHYGFNIEAILPFHSEETQGKRPNGVSLLGIAVGPVQGHFQRAYSPSSEDSPKERDKLERKFRLLMYYIDHTILAYEISRPSSNETEFVC